MNLKYKFQRFYLKASNHISMRLRIGMITLFNYDDVGDFHDGLAKVCCQNKWGFINKYGFEVVSCMYEEAGYFCQGRAKVRSKGKWGYLDKKAKVRVSFMFDEVRDFKYGAAKVTQFNKSYYIDKNGNQISSIYYGKIGRFHLIFRLYELIKKKKRN